MHHLPVHDGTCPMNAVEKGVVNSTSMAAMFLDVPTLYCSCIQDSNDAVANASNVHKLVRKNSGLLTYENTNTRPVDASLSQLRSLHMDGMLQPTFSYDGRPLSRAFTCVWVNRWVDPNHAL